MPIRLLNALKLDCMMLKSNSKQILLLFGIIIFMAFNIGQDAGMFVVILMFFTASIAGMVFATAEKNNSERLYGSLPLSRLEMVIARYLLALFLGIFAALLSIIMLYFSSYNSNIAVEWGQLGLSLTGGIIYFAFYVSVCYPIYFRIPFSKASIFTMVPMIAIYVGAIALTSGEETISWLTGFLNWINGREQYILPAGIAISILSMFISMLISVRIRKNKEI